MKNKDLRRIYNRHRKPSNKDFSKMLGYFVFILFALYVLGQLILFFLNRGF